MAKVERRITGDFDTFLNYIHKSILSGSISASFQGGSDFNVNEVRCAVRVYERYSIIGSNRLAANITLLGVGDDLSLSIITSGGSQAVFFKINTFGEEAFADKIAGLVNRWVQKNS